MKLTQMVAFHYCVALSLVQPTGGGKCADWDSFVIVLVGVMLATTPLLSFGTDQANKAVEKPPWSLGLSQHFTLQKSKIL
jgi:hypothetical protein